MKKWQPRPEKPGIEDGEQQSDPVEIRRKAMDLLARREHSHYELEQKLASRGMHADVVQAVLHELDDEGLLDDQRFADSFVSHRAGKGQGPVRIRADLKQRGIQGEHVENLLGGHDWLALARRVRLGKFGSGIPAEFSERARQARFLTYRGFTSEQAMAVLDSDGHGDDYSGEDD